MRSGEQQSGVDRACDVGRRCNLAEHGDTADVNDVASGQAAFRLCEQHDAVRKHSVLRHERPNAEIAGTPQNRQKSAYGLLGELIEAPGVNNDRCGIAC
jgi:hypothetical protein